MLYPEPMQGEPLELSVVMPCLDEADTLATCISKAQRAMSEHGVRGEVVVADIATSTAGLVDLAAPASSEEESRG